MIDIALSVVAFVAAMGNLAANILIWKRYLNQVHGAICMISADSDGNVCLTDLLKKS